MGQVFGKNHQILIVTFHYDSSSLLAQSDPRRSRLDLQAGPSVRMVVKLLINAFRTKTRTLCYSTRLTKDHSPARFEYIVFPAASSLPSTALTSPHFTLLPFGITCKVFRQIRFTRYSIVYYPVQ